MQIALLVRRFGEAVRLFAAGSDGANRLKTMTPDGRNEHWMKRKRTMEDSRRD